MVQLGQKVQDVVTGFKGTATAIGTFLAGPDQVFVTPTCKADGTIADGCWFDKDRLEVIDASILKLPVHG